MGWVTLGVKWWTICASHMQADDARWVIAVISDREWLAVDKRMLETFSHRGYSRDWNFIGLKRVFFCSTNPDWDTQKFCIAIRSHFSPIFNNEVGFLVKLLRASVVDYRWLAFVLQFTTTTLVWLDSLCIIWWHSRSRFFICIHSTVLELTNQTVSRGEDECQRGDTKN